MHKKLLAIGLLFSISISAHATDLLAVYQEALTNDTIFQQAVAQRLADREAVPISFANLLPNVGLTATPNVFKSSQSGPGSAPAGIPIGSYSQRGYQMYLTATQTIFNFAQFENLAGAKDTAKEADATFSAAEQSLILRVSNAYFAVLQDEENLRYNDVSKAAYAKQLDQVRQQYRVGLKTITDVYTAKASYDSSVASYIAAQTQLEDDKENLRVITGKTYPSFAALSENFPLISPQPANMETWVYTAQKQNWNIRAAQFADEAALANVKQQFGGHLPTLNAEGIYNVDYTRNTGAANTLFYPPGAEQIHNRTFEFNLDVPIFEGGEVVAQTHKAQYQYQVASQQLEQTMRNTINTTRQSYLGVISGISKIRADQQAIKSSQSSLEGMEASYRVGTETLVDVLNQQQKLFQAQTQYATDRYAYVNSLLTLKQAAGTLSPEDLQAINSWLGQG